VFSLVVLFPFLRGNVNQTLIAVFRPFFFSLLQPDCDKYKRLLSKTNFLTGDVMSVVQFWWKIEENGCI